MQMQAKSLQCLSIGWKQSETTAGAAPRADLRISTWTRWHPERSHCAASMLSADTDQLPKGLSSALCPALRQESSIQDNKSVNINLTRIRVSLIYDLSLNFLNLMHCCVPLGHPWATCVHADPPARQWAVRDLRSCAQNRDLQCQRLHHRHGLSTMN